MRVIAGRWRGLPLVAPRGATTRPTSDKARGAVFNVLAGLVASAPEGAAPLAGAVVLDLFAGSGAVGLEALSRGAASCTFVERERDAVRALSENLERCRLEVGGEEAHVLAGDYRRALTTLAAGERRFTLVYVDPPYRMYSEVEAFLRRSLAAVLAPRALIVVETDIRTALDLPWPVTRQKRYGDTVITFALADQQYTTEVT